jgi:pimeloyl-ACP methyl ester carboxylesterase
MTILRRHTLTTDDGIRLNVVEAGNPAGRPIVFIHGLSQSWRSWIRQFADDELRRRGRLIALDLRGHGRSEGAQDATDERGCAYAPLPQSAYLGADRQATGRLWSGDLAAVIDGLALDAPTVVGWSYGGAVLADYLTTRNGLSRIDKAMILSSPVGLRPPGSDAALGADRVFDPGALAAASTITPHHLPPSDPPVPTSNAEVAAGLTSFVEFCLRDAVPGRAPPSRAEVQSIVAYNLLTPPEVRLWIMLRDYDHRAFYRALTAADKAKIRVLLPTADAVITNAGALGPWQSTGVSIEQPTGEGHLYAYRNPAGFNADLLRFVSS